jgi:NADPH:quinone reductase-like Zn-dependent oxidoreductase
MRAVVCREAGGPEVLEVREVPEPTPGPGEVVIDIAAAGVNRPDLQQRLGVYPPPPGASDVLGLECSGTISAVGDGVERWHVGDEVCALLISGGYADKVVTPAGLVLPVPAGLSLLEAAALPEVACTVWSNVFMIAHALARRLRRPSVRRRRRRSVGSSAPTSPSTTGSRTSSRRSGSSTIPGPT